MPVAVPPHFDHVVVATPDLQATVAEVTRATGVAPEAGGVHPRFGTCNYLLTFGEAGYLELIGIDPQNTEASGPRPFGLDRITETHVSTWVIHPPSLTQAVAAARDAGLDLGDPMPGSRRTAEGELLEWELTRDHAAEPTGLIPFLIDWGATSSPATTLTARLELVELAASHPDPEQITPVLAALGTELDVVRGPAGLRIVVQGPGGRLAI